MDMEQNTHQQNNQKNNQSKPGLSWTQPSPNTNAPKIYDQKTTPPATTPSSGRTKWWIGLAVVCIIAALFAIGLRHRGSEKGPAATTTTTGAAKTESTSTQNMPNSVTVGSIKGLGVSPVQDAGTEVAVSVEEVSAPAWVVVYESNNGKPGNVLGAGYMTPTLISATVPLLRATLAGQTYFIGQTTDDGDGAYSMQKDAALRDEEGNLVLIEFKTR